MRKLQCSHNSNERRSIMKKNELVQAVFNDICNFIPRAYRRKGALRGRFLAKNPFKRTGESFGCRARVVRHRATKAIILYTYWTENEHYKNYWYRCLLANGPKKGKIVSV